MIPMEDLADVAKPGWVPLVILILMFVVVFFLWRSMRKMMRTIDPGLPHRDDPIEDPIDAEVGASEPNADDTTAPTSPR